MSDTLIDCRAAFEKWVLSGTHPEEDFLERDSAGNYVLGVTKGGWAAWQAALYQQRRQISLPSDEELIQKMLDAQPIREPVIKSTNGVVTASEIKHQALIVKLRAGLEALRPYLREPKRE